MTAFRLHHLLWLVPLLVVLVFLPSFTTTFITYLLSLICIYVIVALGINILTGYTGQMSVGHAGFLAIGAYTSARLITDLGAPFWVGMLVAGLASGIVGFLLGIPALRLSGAYLSTATLGFGLAVEQILQNMDSVSGGRAGLSVPKPSLAGFVLDDRSYFYFVLAVTIVMSLLALSILRSSVGRAFIALRDSEIAAQAMGISLARYKTLAFTMSAFYTGIAGALFASLVRFLAPENFNMWLSIDFLTMIVIGGLASVLGSVIGGIFMVTVPYVLGELQDLSFILMGAALLVVLLFMPGGISAFLSRLLDLVTGGTTAKDIEQHVAKPMGQLGRLPEQSQSANAPASGTDLLGVKES